LLLLSLVVLAAYPVSARALFLQTKEQEAGVSAPEKDVSVLYSMQSYRLKYANAKELGKTLEGLLAKGEGVAVNEKLNTLVVRASEKNIQRLTKLIQNVDAPPLQVQVEAKII
jgi:type II secretory pathway component GspD/PulD (secretin)